MIEKAWQYEISELRLDTRYNHQYLLYQLASLNFLLFLFIKLL